MANDDSAIFRPDDRGMLRGTRTLTESSQVWAIALLDNGRRIITSERYGQSGACLVLYDAATRQVTGELVFADGIHQPYALGVCPDPDRVIIDAGWVGSDLSIVDLRNRRRVGQRLSMMHHNSGPIDGSPIRWWHRLGKREAFRTSALAVFDGGKRVVAHCGIAAPRMPSQLLTWDLTAFQLIAGPVRTPDVSESPMLTDDMAGVADVKNRLFLTGQRFGWVNFWDSTSLRHVRAWRVQSPSGCDRSIQNCANNQIESIALTEDATTVAVGTWCGAIHIVNAETGKESVAPLVPHGLGHSFPGWLAKVTAVAFVDEHRGLLAGYGDGSIRRWDSRSGRQLGAPLCGGGQFENSVTKLIVVPRMNYAISIHGERGTETEVRVWPLG